MWCRGIRGATAVPENSRDAIIAASRELLQQMVDANGVKIDDVACILFTTTPDLNAAFPAAAARELGWLQVPLLCSQEMDVPDGFPHCLRILMLFNTEKRNEDIVHLYLRGTEVLRDDMNRSS
ncbi:MAG: chorismate mutase [Chloroflexi bacterium]|nr:chorismate mutase [Chloroflexota bacterium]MBM3182783.1 chorismate mutase [Chloroflexota bacterium]MBM4452370.1 chorismate mutase [Chloroflexota bacterium]MBM4453979.1 chorismate mutase [Chloroflexota bacterium]